MAFFDFLKSASSRGQDAQQAAARQAAAQRRDEIVASLREDTVPPSVVARLQGARSGTLPWLATLTPAELMIVRSHGLRPIASVSATCWMQYGRSWTMGHQEGWTTALRRLRAEARAAGANAVLDVKMRTIPLAVPNSMDFTLVGTAMFVEGLQPTREPLVATVPALEFVKLLEADIVPTGIAIGAHYEWLSDWTGGAAGQVWMGNIESRALSDFWNQVRRQAQAELKRSARPQGNGVLAHVDFSQMFKIEKEGDQPTRYLGRHIIVATTIDDAARGRSFPHEIAMAVDMRDDAAPLVGRAVHHQSYATRDEEGPI